MHIFPRAGKRASPTHFGLVNSGCGLKRAGLIWLISIQASFLLAHAGRKPKRAKTLKNAKKN